MIVLSAGIRSLLWNSQRSGPESASRGTCHPGRDHPGMVGDIISERWARSSRNGWATSFRNQGRLAPESAPITAQSRTLLIIFRMIYNPANPTAAMATNSGLLQSPKDAEHKSLAQAGPWSAILPAA